MFELLLLAYLSYRNGMRAKIKGLNGLLWALYTAAAFFVCMVVGMVIVIMNFCRDVIDLDALPKMDYKSRQVATQQLIQSLYAHPLQTFAIYLFGFGGYLIVRYLLEKKPGVGNLKV